VGFCVWTIGGPGSCAAQPTALLKSPSVAAQLSHKLRALHDRVERWIALLKGQLNVESRLTGSTVEHGTEGKTETFERIAAFSAAVCVSCSAEEI
jgi:hypothetical protein